MYRFVYVFLLLFSLIFASGWQNVDELYEHLKEIQLTEDQDKKVRILLREYYKDLKDWWKRHKKVNNELLSFFDSGDFSKMQENIKNAYLTKVKIDLDFLKELYNMLTKEQRKRLAESFSKEQ